MRSRALLACGIAMPAIYFLMLIVSWRFNPGFDLMHQEPSELGRATAAYPSIYNSGMVATAIAGLIAALGLMTSRNMGRGSPWGVWAGVTVLLASGGIAMAGLFPLPNPLHYGFGLTTAAVVTPLLGAVSMWRSANPRAAMALIAGFILIIGLVASAVSPLAPGAVMFASIAYLCWNVRQLTGMLHV